MNGRFSKFFQKKQGKALVVFSGGQDSTTCLGWALKVFSEVQAIGFSYGQTHRVELKQAELICGKLGVPFTVHEIPSLQLLGDSALTTGGSVEVPHHRSPNLPASFVPNRNALFLTISHAFAQKLGYSNLVTGVCETDYSGYPDCREVFIRCLEDTLNLGYQTNMSILTPLMHLDKADTFHMSFLSGVLPTVLEHSHTCYNGDREHSHSWGKGCGNCPACTLRAKGYEKYLATDWEAS